VSRFVTFRVPPGVRTYRHPFWDRSKLTYVQKIKEGFPRPRVCRFCITNRVLTFPRMRGSHYRLAALRAAYIPPATATTKRAPPPFLPSRDIPEILPGARARPSRRAGPFFIIAPAFKMPDLWCPPHHFFISDFRKLIVAVF
jgi:hypothetical protein